MLQWEPENYGIGRQYYSVLDVVTKMFNFYNFSIVSEANHFSVNQGLLSKLFVLLNKNVSCVISKKKMKIKKKMKKNRVACTIHNDTIETIILHFI